MNKWPLQKDCDSFYGNPRDPKNPSKSSAAWERANLTNVVPPFKITYDGKPVKSIRIHKKCAESFLRILNKLWEIAEHDQKKIDEWGISILGGSYVYRLMRGGNALSMHSYGCAIDFDPARNALYDSTPRFANYPEVIQVFYDEGWEWGGPWSRYDGMHWQAAWTKSSALNSFPDLKRLGGGKAEQAKPVSKPKPSSKPVPSKTKEITDKEEVKKVQQMLKDKGWPEVGLVDGAIGGRTITAILSFRNEVGLPNVKYIDQEMIDALKIYAGRPVSQKRATATSTDLKKEGDPVILTADNIKTAGIVTAGFAGIGGADQQGAIDKAKEAIDGLGTVKTIGDQLLDIVQWAAQKWWIPVLLVAGYFIYRQYLIKKTRVQEFRVGQNLSV